MARRRMPLWQSAPLWVLVTAAAVAVAALPRRLEVLLGRLIGRLMLLVAGGRRRITIENLGRCLPELSDAQRALLLRRNFEHFGILLFEMLHMFCPVPGHFRRYVQRISVLSGGALGHWKKAHAKGKGVIYAGNHVGNWEVVAAQGGLHGMDMMIVTRNLTPVWVHQAMERARLSVAVQAALPPKTLPTVLKALRKEMSVVFAMDQYAPPDAGGIKARFFGYRVDTLGAIALIARKTGAAVLPGSSYRDEAGLIHVFVDAEIELSGAAGDLEKSTQLIVDRTESYIRAHPEQWTWGHRRFKHVDWNDRLPAAAE
ncbi:MAG: hypothetical protein AAB320_11270 [Elusimicrobiota bacterium]